MVVSEHHPDDEFWDRYELDWPHSHGAQIESSRVTKWLWWVIGAWGVATVVGLIALWPSGRHESQDISEGAERLEATVTSVAIQPCAGTDASQGVPCRAITFDITSGSADGTTAVIEQGVSESSAKVPEPGDDVVLERQSDGNGGFIYSFVDYRRGQAMLVLVVIFVGACCCSIDGAARALSAWPSVSWCRSGSCCPPCRRVEPSVGRSGRGVVHRLVSLYSPTVRVGDECRLLSTLLSLALTDCSRGSRSGDNAHGSATRTRCSSNPRRRHRSSRPTAGRRGDRIARRADDVTVTQVSAVAELHLLQPAAGVASSIDPPSGSAGTTSPRRSTRWSWRTPAQLPLLLFFTEVGNPSPKSRLAGGGGGDRSTLWARSGWSHRCPSPRRWRLSCSAKGPMVMRHSSRQCECEDGAEHER